MNNQHTDAMGTGSLETSTLGTDVPGTDVTGTDVPGTDVPCEVETVRAYLRISHNRLDSEIGDLIAAARADLTLGGIEPAKAADWSDPLIRRAVVVYVKANFGLDNAECEKYTECYEMLKRHLMLSESYTSAEL